MSRSSTPVLAASALSPALLLGLMLVLMPRAAAETATPANGSCDVKSCALLEASLLEEYVSGLNASGLPLSEEGNETLPPFGALPSDWSRLQLLLQNSQPEGTPLREGLLRLSRLVLAAYFDSQERHHWTDQLLADHHGQGGGGDAAVGAASEAESEDQQASNATSGSTARKGSTRINASSIDVAAYNNGGSQPGNFSGSEEDSTTSHYAAVLPTAEGANFNQTFSSAADNEADKSNETSSPEDSAANEVLHERSREELHRALEDDDSGEVSFSLEFNSTMSDEDFFASAEKRDAVLVDEFFATEATANETQAPEELFASSEDSAPLTKSVEDFFAASDEATPSAEDFSQAVVTGNPEIAGDSSTAAGISEEPAARDSGESRKNEDNPTATTTMARLISGDALEDRSGRPESATAAGAAPVPAAENRTSDRPDDLFSESTTTQRRPGDDWNSTGSIEPTTDGAVTPVAVRLRRSVLQYLRRESSSAAAIAVQPVPPPGPSYDSREEDATASARNRQRRRVRRNKRRTRKRAGAEQDVEGQYPSFDGREPGQALLADERSAENSARSPQ